MGIQIYIDGGDGARQPFCYSIMGRNLGVNRRCLEIYEFEPRAACVNYVSFRIGRDVCIKRAGH